MWLICGRRWCRCWSGWRDFSGSRSCGGPWEGGIEYRVLTYWASLASIRAFAGEDVETAVVPPEAQALMVSWDEHVQHFEVVGTSL